MAFVVRTRQAPLVRRTERLQDEVILVRVGLRGDPSSTSLAESMIQHRPSARLYTGRMLSLIVPSTLPIHGSVSNPSTLSSRSIPGFNATRTIAGVEQSEGSNIADTSWMPPRYNIDQSQIAESLAYTRTKKDIRERRTASVVHSERWRRCLPSTSPLSTVPRENA